jgi:hypothetical protein
LTWQIFLPSSALDHRKALIFFSIKEATETGIG